MRTLQNIAFDADDTLWHNETIFAESHRRYCDLLAHYHDSETVEKTLFATEMRNLELLGYGVKAHALSAIETAIDLTDGTITADEIKGILTITRDMLRQPVELIDGVVDVLEKVAQRYRLFLITKGDLLDQERKVAASGLSHYFEYIDVVSEKDPQTYERLIKRLDVDISRFAMIGNSLKSDVKPVLELGGYGIHVPYAITWAAEETSLPDDKHAGRYFKINDLSELLPLLDEID
tara:strand:- start:16250 stop:16954 length:705 start_codon:yes stop_codon:yes gene_type:complete